MLEWFASQSLFEQIFEVWSAGCIGVALLGIPFVVAGALEDRRFEREKKRRAEREAAYRLLYGPGP